MDFIYIKSDYNGFPATDKITMYNDKTKSVKSFDKSVPLDNKFHHIALCGTTSALTGYLDGVNMGTINLGVYSISSLMIGPGYNGVRFIDILDT